MQIYKIIFYLPKKSSPSPIFIYRVHSDFGMMKLEIESDKVDDAEEFCASMHIRGVRLHFLPKSDKGSPALYQDIMFEEERI